MLMHSEHRSRIELCLCSCGGLKAGFSCEYPQSSPGWRKGLDATITEDERQLAVDSKLTSLAVDIQLKATYQHLAEQGRKVLLFAERATVRQATEETLMSPPPSPGGAPLARQPGGMAEHQRGCAHCQGVCLLGQPARSGPSSQRKQPKPFTFQHPDLLSPSGLHPLDDAFLTTGGDPLCGVMNCPLCVALVRLARSRLRGRAWLATGGGHQRQNRGLP